MINSFDSFLVKAANSVDRAAKAEERRNIRKAIRRTGAKTLRERQIEQLAGRQHTPGQLARGGLIGAGFGAAAHVGRDAIEKGRRGVAGSLKNPRSLVGSVITGSLFGAAVPAVRRRADIAAAEQGWY